MFFATLVVIVGVFHSCVGSGYKDNGTSIDTNVTSKQLSPGKVGINEPTPVVKIKTPSVDTLSENTGKVENNKQQSVGNETKTTQAPVLPTTASIKIPEVNQPPSIGVDVTSSLVLACQKLQVLLSGSPIAYQIMVNVLPSVPSWLYGPSGQNQCQSAMYPEIIRAFATTCALLTTCRFPTPMPQYRLMPTLNVFQNHRPQLRMAATQQVFAPPHMRPVVIPRTHTLRQNVNPAMRTRAAVWRQTFQVSNARRMVNRLPLGARRTAIGDSTQADPDNSD